MRSLIAALLCLVALPGFCQVQTPQQIAGIAQQKARFGHAQCTRLKGIIAGWQTYAPRVRAYSASLKGSNGSPVANAAKMALGDQRKLDGDAEEASGDTFSSQAATLEAQGDAAYAAGNYAQARKLYDQAAAAHGESEKRLQLSVNGYAGAVQFWELAIR